MEYKDSKMSVFVYRVLCMACIVVAVLVFGGIYNDYHEIEKIDLLQVVGIDHEGDMVKLAALGSQKSGEKPILYRGEGRAMNQAAANMQTEAGAEYLHFGHVKYIVISKEAAESKISDVLDYCIRMPDIGLNAALYYVEETALENMSSLDEGQNLSKILEAMAMKGRETSIMYSYTLMDVVACIKRNGFALASCFKVEEGQVVPNGTAVLPEEGKPFLLNMEQTYVLALLDGRLKNFSLVLEGEENKGVGIDISETNVKYDIDGKELVIEVTLQCGLDELYTEQEMLDRQGIVEIEQAIQTKIKKQIDGVIDLSKNVEIDICQLGQQAYLLSGNKECMDFQNFETTVKVVATINRTYAIGEGADDE
ncbi:MAG: hypothetical protein IKV30_03660 [Clostridia bacterium]|nr:hypothetical protein [Clostridia bacterium]